MKKRILALLAAGTLLPDRLRRTRTPHSLMRQTAAAMTCST